MTAHDHRECVATHYPERNPKPLPRRFKEQSEPVATVATNPVCVAVVRSRTCGGSVATGTPARTQGSPSVSSGEHDVGVFA